MSIETMILLLAAGALCRAGIPRRAGASSASGRQGGCILRGGLVCQPVRSIGLDHFAKLQKLLVDPSHCCWTAPLQSRKQLEAFFLGVGSFDNLDLRTVDWDLHVAVGIRVKSILVLYSSFCLDHSPSGEPLMCIIKTVAGQTLLFLLR